jgi:hypothetical protein
LTGWHVFDAESTSSLADQILTKKPLSSSPLNPELNASVDSVFLKAMAERPAERFATCRDFVDALETSLRHSSSSVTAPPARSAFRLNPASPTFYKGSVLAAVVIIIIALSIVVFPHSYPMPRIVGFTANPTNTPTGGTVTLHWYVQNASRVEIQPDIGIVPATGSRTVSPAETTSYEILAIGPDGRVASKLELIVKVPVHIAITEIPANAEGGPEILGSISGVVRSTDVDRYQVVIYAKAADTWYVQPFIAAPFTKITRDGEWHNITHLGREYAALVVTPSFKPESVLQTVPEVGGGVIAVAVR